MGERLTDHAILVERARTLARPLGDALGARDDALTLAALVVRVGASTYAVPLAEVVEILPAGRIAPLPGASSPVVGVVAWRGRVLAVRALHASVGGATDARPVVVVGDARTPLALVVDAVDEIRPLGAVAATDNESTDASTAPTIGVTPDAIAVLDVPALRRQVAAADES